MGIRRFNQYLSKQSIRNWPRQFALSEINPPVVAIDVMTILFAFYNRAITDFHYKICKGLNKDINPLPIILNMLGNFANSFIKHKLIPVFVFDGAYPQAKKDNEHRRRKENGKRLEINAKMLIATCQNFLRDSGIPVLQAHGEAERLCASLCKENLVFAVYSTDSDIFAHGCPRQIKKSKNCGVFMKDNDEDIIEIFELQALLDKFALDEEKFREACILAGCDYNCNIPGVAFGNALGLIIKHGSIDQLPEKYDITCLNHQTCRELFAPVSAQEICQDTIPDRFTCQPPAENFNEKWIIPNKLTFDVEKMLSALKIQD